jgi:restriction system protein
MTTMTATLSPKPVPQYRRHMAVPGFEAFLLPVLRAYGDGQDLSTVEARARVASAMGLNEADLAERLPNSPQLRATNRINWAQIYLQRAALLERIRRGIYKITDRGRDFLKTSPTTLSMVDLGRYPEFREWRRVDDESSEGSAGPAVVGATQTPDEVLDSAFKVVRTKIEKDLTDRILAGSPELLEKIAIRLVEAMGYGKPGDGAHLGHSGDGGVDGVVPADPLGLDRVYIQAKRYDPERAVPIRDVRDFLGALESKRAKHGIFITTAGSFPREAHEMVNRIEKRLALIDGATLGKLLYEFGVGVSEERVLVVKRIDEDTFIED